MAMEIILDVGTGNGVLISRFIQELVSLKGIKKAHIILVDPSESMLNSARTLCETEISIPLAFTLIQGKIEQLEVQDVRRIRAVGQVSFINAAASIHHMPRDKKRTLLQFFSALSQCTTLIDFHSNHDLPARESPDLVFSVATQYGYYLQDVMNGNASDEDKRACNFQFILAEAINILKNSYEHRIDYHTPICEWRKLADEAGMVVHDSVSLVCHGDRTMTFGMVLRSD